MPVLTRGGCAGLAQSKGSIVELDGLPDDRFTIEHAGTKAVFDYWNAIRNGSPAAPREAVDPCALRSHLPQIFILQKHDDQHITFRLAGTGMCAIFGREFRDQNFFSMFTGDCEEKARAMAAHIIGDYRVGLMSTIGYTIDRREAAFEVIMLPLMDQQGDVCRVLGSLFVTQGQTLMRQKVFVRQRINTVKLINPDIDRVANEPSMPVKSNPMPRLYLIRSNS